MAALIHPNRASQPPDESHPLGYGRELYFWSFIVALIMFTLGAGVAFYEGIQHVLHPTETTNPMVNYIVLSCAFVFEGVSWYIALREFRRTKGDLGYFEAMRRSKDPVGFTVLFEDSAAMLGLVIAFAGTFLGQYLAMPVLDGVASLAIGAVLAATAFVLARESKGLLIGEPATRAVRESILATLKDIPEIDSGQIAFTVHMSPDEIVVAFNLEFEDHLTAPQIEKATVDLERAIHGRHPDVIAVFVKPRVASHAGSLTGISGRPE